MLRLTLAKRLPLHHSFGIKKFFQKLFSRPSRLFEDDFQEQQSFSLQNPNPNKPPIPKTIAAAEKSLMETEQEVSILERGRLRRIDQQLGTRTFFYNIRPYEIRLDSEHIMEIKRIKVQMIIDRLKAPPKVDLKTVPNLRVSNRKQFWKTLAKTRQYPQHKKVDFKDESGSSLIEFLAREVLYTKVSFNSIEHLKSYFLKEDITRKTYLMYSPKYVYYNIPNSPLLGRTLKTRFPDQANILDIPEGDIQVVMNLDEIYNTFLKHDNNPFVEEFLKDVEAGTLKGTVTSSIQWTDDENHLIVLIDLTGQQTQFAIVVKNLMTASISDVIFDVSSSLGVVGKKVYFLRRDSLEMLTELCHFDVETKQTGLVYRQREPLNLNFTLDVTGKYLYLFRSEISDPWKQKVMILGLGQSSQVIEVDTEHGYQYQLAFVGNGFIYCKFQTNKNLQFSPLFPRISRHLHFIPIVTSTELTTWSEQRHLRKVEEMKDIISKYNQIADQKIQISQPLKDVVLSNNHQLLYTCAENEAIESMLGLETEVVLNVVGSWKVQEYLPASKLHVIPRKPHTSQNSLILPDQHICFAKSQDYYSQKVAFKLKDLVETIMVYTTWNDDLEIDRPDTVHTSSFQFLCRDGTKQLVTTYCEDSFRNSCSDCVLIFSDQKQQEIDLDSVRCLLKKGTLVAIYKGRGSIHGSYDNYQEGTGEGMKIAVNDLMDTVIELHERGLTENVGLYAKGKLPGHIAALFSIMQPYAFTATVIHNGSFGYQKHQSQVGSDKDLHNKDPHSIQNIPFAGRNLQEGVLEIDDLENILVSSTKEGRQDARRLMHYLRQGKKKYDEVFYVEASSNREADLTNLCYLYRLMIDNSPEYNRLRDDFT